MTYMSLVNYFMYPPGSNLKDRKHIKYFPQGVLSTSLEERLTIGTGRGGRQRFLAAGALSSPGEETRGDDAPTVWFPGQVFAAGLPRTKIQLSSKKPPQT